MFSKFVSCNVIISVITGLLLTGHNMKPIIPDSQAYAYLEVFISITEDIRNADSEIEYIAVNLTGILYDKPSEIKKLIKDYAGQYDIEVRWDTEGISGNRVFNRNSFLVIFEDTELTETKLTTNMSRWNNPRFATGFTYTVEKEAAGWKITESQLNWIS